MRTCRHCQRTYNATLLEDGNIFVEDQSVTYSICPYCGTRNNHIRTMRVAPGHIISEPINQKDEN
jgi:hypothetical protein